MFNAIFCCFIVHGSDGSDYITTSRQLDFSVSNDEICTNVNTVEDDVFEDDEQFRATLVGIGNLPRLTIQPDEATVNIINSV